MKHLFRAFFLAVAVLTAACTLRERTLVILSTNDMHAKIQRFPQLAAAVEACRDTAQLVVLVDAGDRWTGNAFVDKVSVPGKPMIELMNRLGYDVMTFGNHEFDHGQAFLGRMVDSISAEIVCANCISDTCTFPQVAPYAVIERDGIRIGFVGAVTNYEGPGHPAGHASSFVGLEFPDPQAEAIRYAEYLRPRVDLLVLLSHMGDDRDMELLGKTQLFDLVIGGHTHAQLDTLVNGTLLTQSGKNLQNVGATTVRMRGRKVESIDYRIVPLDAYEPDASFAEQVAGYYADPELNRFIGKFAAQPDKTGLANWMARAIAEDAGADIGVYHVGGVRLDSIAAGRCEPRPGLRSGAVRHQGRHAAHDARADAAHDHRQVQRGYARGTPRRHHSFYAVYHSGRRIGPGVRCALPCPARGSGLFAGHERLYL